ncbi:hypothetical protein L208DRAFT_1315759, partial [Tricholoma matsutake]
VNILTSYRENGWCRQGLRARKSTKFVRGIRGIIYSHIKTGSYNGEQFLDWLEGLLQVMNPYPAPHSVLILDNCRMHHVEGVAEMCKER